MSHCPETGMWEITPGKSASVYECFPFIWTYNAHPVDLKKSASFAATRTERRLYDRVDSGTQGRFMFLIRARSPRSRLLARAGHRGLAEAAGRPKKIKGGARF